MIWHWKKDFNESVLVLTYSLIIIIIIMTFIYFIINLQAKSDISKSVKNEIKNEKKEHFVLIIVVQEVPILMIIRY